MALRLGCNPIIAHGPAGTGEAAALRRMVKSAGARFENLGAIEALPELLAGTDRLLVLQQGLRPQAAEAQAILARGEPVVLVVVPQGAALAGLERIDLTSAFAGAMIIPAQVVADVGLLPEGAALASGLLRLALQHHVPRQPLPQGALDRGEWDMVTNQQQADLQARRWLAGRLGRAPALMPGHRAGLWLARHLCAVLRIGPAGLGADLARWRAGLGLACGLLLAGGLGLGWAGHGAAGFGAIALGLPLLHAREAMARLDLARLDLGGRDQPDPASGAPGAARWPDLVLAACAALALEGPWHRQMFAPLVLVLALGLLDRQRRAGLAGLARDRALVAALAGMGLALFAAEPVLALLALVMLAAAALPDGGGRTGLDRPRITPD